MLDCSLDLLVTDAVVRLDCRHEGGGNFLAVVHELKGLLKVVVVRRLLKRFLLSLSAVNFIFDCGAILLRNSIDVV